MNRNRKFSVILLALMLVFSSVFNISYAADVIKPTQIQQVNIHVGNSQEDSRNITWITKDQKDSTIVVKDSAGKEVFKDTLKGEKRENINSTVNPETKKNEKEVIYSYQSEVTGLKPNESYTYEISNEDSKFEGSFKVSRAKNEAGKIRFIMIADPQVSVDSKPEDGKFHPYISEAHGANFNYINEYAKQNPLDFLYIAGDHTDKGTNEDHWRVFYSNDGDFKTAPQDFLRNNTLVSTVGNHDSNDFAGHINAPDLGKGTYEESVYSSNFGNVKFIVLNNANKKMPDGEIITEEYLKNDKGFQNMVEFLRKEVKDAKDNGMWTIVGFHKPLYTGASHMKDDDMRAYRKLLNPIFTELDVDMVLAGHDHVYTRAFIDKDGKNTTTKVKEINGKPVYKNIENSVFHLVGEHGAGLKWYDAVLDYKTPEGDPLLPRYEFADKNSAQEEPPSGETREQTFTIVEIDGDKAHFTAYKSKYKDDPYMDENPELVAQYKEKTGRDLKTGYAPYVYDEFYIVRENKKAEKLNPIKIKGSETTPITKWAHGEIHNHTLGSNDASEPYMILQNILNAAFREDLNKIPREGDISLEYGDSFDYLMTAEHLRKSPRNINGESDETPTYKYVAEQAQKWNELKESGKYNGKIYYPGFEWDMFGLDHAAVGIIGENPEELPIDAVREFEWLYSYSTPSELFNDKEEELYGPRSNEKSDKENTFRGLEWLEKNYPNSIMIVNHPSRKNGGSSELKAEDLRRIQDTAPSVFAGIEGIPGNQMGWDRGELNQGDIFGGADKIVTEVGGMWDALLGEGRKVYTFANSDFHFKISSNRLYSSGYWPSEYSRNITWVEDAKNYADIAKALKTGNSTMVTGDLISRLEFNATQDNKVAVMGSILEARKGDTVTLQIKFKESDFNNYKELTPHTTDVTNKPEVDHIDIIAGEVRPNNDKTLANNDTTKVIKTFNRSEFGPKDAEGYYTLKFEVPNEKDMYYRLRGTNLGINVDGETENGNPVADKSERRPDNVSAEPYFNEYNDRNYRDLWFYSNPIFIKALDLPKPIDPKPIDPKPVDPRPVDPKPVDLKPVDPRPSRPSSNDDDYYNPKFIGFFGYGDTTTSPLNPVTPSTITKPVITDIAGHWGENPITTVVNKGYMDIENGKFYPNRDATRLEFVRAMARMAGANPNDYMNKKVFDDVVAGTKDAGYINWAYEKGIVKGNGEGKFEGSREITRQEIATILNRYTDAMGLNLDKKDEKPFADDGKIADWAKKDVKEARQKGIFSGKDNNMFDPMANITRAEVAQVAVNIDK